MRPDAGADDQDPPGGWAFAAAVTVGLVAATVAAVAVPVLAAVVLVALVPGLSELRVSSPWAVLHLLWMAPALWLASLVIDPVARYLVRSSPIWENAAGGVALWAAAFACLSVFLTRPLDAGLAALVALVGLAAFTALLRPRTNPARRITASR